MKIFLGLIDQREKTLVFCATQAHALAVRDLINQMKISTDPFYCVRVTANDGAKGDEQLRAFQDNEKTIPTILTTSQKLSTGRRRARRREARAAAEAALSQRPERRLRRPRAGGAGPGRVCGVSEVFV